MHVYDDQVFVVLHAPELGSGGHVHYIELDQFVGPNYLVTVHGPLNPVVNPDVAFIDTRQVLHRIERGNLHPHTPLELSYLIGSALVRREIDLVAALARESGRLEQQVTDKDHNDDPEALLEDLFEVGHQLLAIRTMATHSAETKCALRLFGAVAPRSCNSRSIRAIASLKSLFGPAQRAE